MDLNARVHVNFRSKDGRTDGLTDRWKSGCLYRILLKQLRQKLLAGYFIYFFYFNNCRCFSINFSLSGQKLGH